MDRMLSLFDVPTGCPALALRGILASLPPDLGAALESALDLPTPTKTARRAASIARDRATRAVTSAACAHLDWPLWIAEAEVARAARDCAMGGENARAADRMYRAADLGAHLAEEQARAARE